MPIGIPELLIVFVIVLLIFGPKRLPMLGRQLGSGMREFKDGITGKKGHDDEDDEAVAGLPAARAQAVDPLSATPDSTRTPTGERDEPVTRRGG